MRPIAIPGADGFISVVQFMPMISLVTSDTYFWDVWPEPKVLSVAVGLTH